MKSKNTLILFLLAAGMFAYIWFVERHGKTTKELAEESTRFVVVDRDKLTGVSIKTTDAKIELRKDEKGVWQIVEPLKDRADSSALSQLFTECETLRYVEKITNDRKGVTKEQLKEFGLNEPATVLTLTSKEKPIELSFGKDTASEGKVYAKVDGSNVVYVISNSLKSAIGKKPDEFRDRKLTNLTATHAQKAILKTAAGEIEMQKDKDSHWSLTRPLKARGDDAKINDLISQAVNARVDSFVADSANLSAYGLQEPRLALTLYSEDNPTPSILQLGSHPTDEKSKDKTYARLSTRDAVVLLPNSIESLVETKPNDLRDRNLIRVEADIVDRMTIESPGREKIVLARKGESWVRKADDKDVEIDVTSARRLLDELRQYTVAQFVADVATELPKYGLDEPAVKVTLSSYASENTAETKAGEKPIVTVLFGKTEGENVYAKLDDEPFVVSVSDGLLGAILTEPLQWQPLAIFKKKPEEIATVEVTREGQPALSIEREKDKGWKLAKGDGKVNQTNMNSLVNTLAKLQAVRWVGPTTQQHGFEKPAVTVAFGTTANVQGKLVIGAKNETEQFYANADGLTGTFIVSKPDKSAFDLELIEKTQTPATQPAPGAAPAQTVPPAATPAPSPAPAPNPATPADSPAPTEAPAQPAPAKP